MTRLKVIVWLVLAISLVHQRGQVKCFNLSPKPNLVIADPQLSTTLPQVHASYFGYSLNLRPSGLIIGAPRAQSTLELQRKINETGAIYRCSLLNGACNPYIFDQHGNRVIEFSEYTFDSERRENQWLGGSMDGGIHDTDKLVVCAPRFIAPSAKDYHMHGLCYWINDTLSDQPVKPTRISPLRLKKDQVREKKDFRYYYYIFGEEGLSAHISENNEEILLGAPGIYTWKGSIIRYRGKKDVDSPSVSRRDTEQRKRVPRQSDYGDGDGGGEDEIVYQSEVPDPEKWDQSDDSYFGYSVGSGYFDGKDMKKLLYVASAPQANEQSGEAYLFDILGNTIKKEYTFRGQQFGEYFGYAILAEDLNNDGLTDVIVSAPLHSAGDSYENGALYVFINQRNFRFKSNFIVSPLQGKARFGSTLTKLGDINHDGYNDVAVGAPFAGNGSVFVYLGGPNGLRDQYSQHLQPPKSVKTRFGGTLMFGHGLSKGSDVDGNGFNDFAIGAPNAEKVFYYRSYPVIKVVASLTTQSREIKPDQNQLQLKACYRITTASEKVKYQDIGFKLVVDPQVKRVKFSSTQNNEMKFNASAGLLTQCRILDCDVRHSLADIFKPIELEIHYEVLHSVPDSEEFCVTCVAVDPADPKVSSEKIIFSTGCATDICVADLEVKSSGLTHSFIIGSRRTFTVTYTVSNNGETAYLPIINITSSNRLPFAKIPSNCRLKAEVYLECDLNKGQPMVNGKKDSIEVLFDVSGVSGTVMILTAEVSSTGKEKTPANNIIKDVITLKQFTEIDATGRSTVDWVSLEEISNSTILGNSYEIKSNGPSVVDALEVLFNIPVAYRVMGTSKVIQIVDTSNIFMQAVYDSQLVGVDFYENKTQLLMNTYELSSPFVPLTSSNGMRHVNEVSHTEILSSDDVVTAGMSKKRSRREAQQVTATKSQYARISQVKSYDLLDDDMKPKLKVNKTIVFSCIDPEMVVCVRAVMKVYNFKANKPITVTLKYTVDLKEVNEILIDPWEYFVIFVDLNVTKVGAATDSELAVVKKLAYNVISKHTVKGVAIWIIIVSVIGGLLLLAVLTYILYRYGFFKRATKDEMDRLVYQGTVSNGEVEPEAETLNSSNNN